MIDTHKLCLTIRYSADFLSFYVNKHEFLANGADLINIHRRTRNEKRETK